MHRPAPPVPTFRPAVPKGHAQALVVLPRTNIPPVGASLPAARSRPAGRGCCHHHADIARHLQGRRRNRSRRVILGNHVWLGRGCTVMPDTTIGNGAVIGTGATATKDIPAMSIAVGVPARIVRSQVTWSRSLDHLDEMSRAYVNQHTRVNAMSADSDR